MTEAELNQKLDELTSLAVETEYVEFKQNNAQPKDIGAYVSAISNSACLQNQEYGWMVWGVEDGSHKVVGTTFDPRTTKKGNEDLEPWMARLLNPRIDFNFYHLVYEGNKVVLLRIDATVNTPVAFEGVAYIRVGSHKKKLKDFPEKARKIWGKAPPVSFEKEVLMKGLAAEDVLSLLDYQAYFELNNIKLPNKREGIIDKLIQERFVLRKPKTFQITNLGAILFARNLESFGAIIRKAIRVVVYAGKNRIETKREYIEWQGYARGFESLIQWINDQLPQNEVVGKALRQEVKLFPELAIRELVANAIVHQDFRTKGASPMIEIFEDRIEITNPGVPLINTLRFIDHSPESRNETLAGLMRRIGVCEERGSGIDKVIFQCEFFQLPAPTFTKGDNFTRVTLFAPKTLRQMDNQDKIRACYQHACLKYVSGSTMTNESLRSRFNIDPKNYSTASRIIKITIETGLVKSSDPYSNSRKHAKYVPFWA